MAKKATPHDGQLMLKLYDLRREAEMRKARNWFVTEFWPQSVEDILKVGTAFPSQENSWMRQVGSYWDMAASLVLQGALHEELFLQPGCSGEMFFIFAKVQPFLKELRQATGSKLARKRLERTSAAVDARRKALAKAKKD
jgi:hypothetical protein